MTTVKPFNTPVFCVNTNGWGPTTLPEQYIGIPFHPFGKNEKLGTQNI